MRKAKNETEASAPTPDQSEEIASLRSEVADLRSALHDLVDRTDVAPHAASPRATRQRAADRQAASKMLEAAAEAQAAFVAKEHAETAARREAMPTTGPGINRQELGVRTIGPKGHPTLHPHHPLNI